MIYKIVLSNKAEIHIAPEELEGVLKGIATGSVVRVKQGIFNPSFFVAIVEDREYLKNYWEQNKYEIQDGTKPKTPLLESIFDNVKKIASPE